jgi:hypothetical protein
LEEKEYKGYFVYGDKLFDKPLLETKPLFGKPLFEKPLFEAKGETTKVNLDVMANKVLEGGQSAIKKLLQSFSKEKNFKSAMRDAGVEVL